MNPIPRPLASDLSPEVGAEVSAWWANLSDAQRAAVARLFEAQQDACFFGDAPACNGDPAPVVIGGRFVPHDDAWGLTEWGPSYYEHLLEHPEVIVLGEPVVFRTFHVCTSHPTARAALAAGRVSADFDCPLDRGDCPMRRVLGLAPGRSLQLFAASPPARPQPRLDRTSPSGV